MYISERYSIQRSTRSSFKSEGVIHGIPSQQSENIVFLLANEKSVVSFSKLLFLFYCLQYFLFAFTSKISFD